MVRLRVALCILLAGLPALAGAKGVVELLFAVEDDWYPYAGVRDGQAVGLTVDIMRAIYQQPGVVVRFQPLSYSRCMEVARTARYAGCFTTSRNDFYEPYYRYPQLPLLEGQIRIYSRSNRPERDLDMKSLEGQEVGVVLSYGYGKEFDANTAIRKEYSTREVNAFRKLKAGRIPYVVAWEGTVNHMLRQNPDLRGWLRPVGKLAPGPVYVSFSRAHPDVEHLVSRFDAGMAQLRKSGRLRQLESRWLDGD
ncbi:transporter substrate-binding domain-containing protein [Vogesella sp. LYT5W]|uniref:Transporter substrate-binding domain-containing protein n=1 Tax=Vogesella margarita TaxID=2984199 RepID=A0ABT5IND3_9NEIS|nr:transporter substrate-binding domain-containing protein [Vogesella margarita]MDC7714012.1 transporter substrate-binding domain-containing protein [Vogesella margarita]